MREPSPTRRELEASIRSMLPDRGSLATLDLSEKPTVASIGVGSAVAGYFWGRLRGRQVRKRKRA